jgi:preprotein translocase subunit SecY
VAVGAMEMAGTATVVRVLREPELWKRLLWTLFALTLFRVGQNLPLPGVDDTALAKATAADDDQADQRLYGEREVSAALEDILSVLIGLGVGPRDLTQDTYTAAVAAKRA